MGVMLEGKCTNCGYRTTLLTGGGMRDCRQETALSIAPDDAGLAAALRAGGQFRIERSPAVCTRCHELTAPALVTYQTPKDEERTIPAVCPKCGGPLERRDDPPCPVCGRPLELRSIGHWD